MGKVWTEWKGGGRLKEKGGRRKVEREGDRLRKLGKDVVPRGVRQGKD